MKATGIPVNRGMVLAPARIIGPWPVFSEEKREFHTPKSSQIASVQNAIATLGAFYTEMANAFYSTGENTRGDILMVHNAILHDAGLQEEIFRHINEDYAPESAVLRAIHKYSDIFAEIDSEYFNQRSSDLDDVAVRLVCAILGLEFPEVRLDDDPVVLIAEEIPPSVMATLHAAQLAGVVLTAGSRTSHSAILAAELGIPVLVGCEGAGNQIKDGNLVFLDANAGELHWNLTPGKIRFFDKMIHRDNRHMQLLQEMAGKDTVTADQTPVALYANGQNLHSCTEISRCGSDGIGLFRTEFLFLDRRTPPGEEEQFQIYQAVVQAMGNKPVIFRTLDMGGDKIIPCFSTEEEANPFMGYRAIRMYLDRKDVFTPQIRAILRASAYGRVGVMFPMISNLEEFLSAKEHVNAMKKELRAQGIAFDENLTIGTMIEVPSAAVNADILAAHADFLSIGTNDLTQYTLAVDRLNVSVSYLYNHFDPAVLRLIGYTLKAAEQSQKPCSVCGEMAADPLAIPLLLGLGLRKFSTTPTALLRTRKLLSLCDIPSCQKLAKEVLQSTSAKEAMRCIHRWIAEEYAKWMN